MASNQDNESIPILISVLSALLIASLTVLSIVAVGSTQLHAYASQGPVKYWYVLAYGLCEIWVALGLCLLASLIQKREWIAVLLCLGLWLPAMGVSAQQEHRFHVQRLSLEKERRAPAREQNRQAVARLYELDEELAAIGPKRPLEAIEAELERYRQAPSRFPTKLAELRGEHAEAEARAAFRAEKRSLEAELVDTAYVTLGPDGSYQQDWSLWGLVAWMMGVKAGGAWLLSRSIRGSNRAPSSRSEVDENETVLSSSGKPMRLIS